MTLRSGKKQRLWYVISIASQNLPKSAVSLLVHIVIDHLKWY